MTQNPYAEIIRILGRGPTKSRHLSREEAFTAFDGLLTGKMSDLQAGALLLLLRYLSENAEELAGIVEAIRHYMGPKKKDMPPQDIIDWPSYSSGKSRRLPWFLLSAKLLTKNGHKVFMHGFNSHLVNGIETEKCLSAIDEMPVLSLAAAKEKIAQDNFAFLPLRNFCPKLEELLGLRAQLGVRSIINTAVKLINPLGARIIYLGIFHPAYIQLNLEGAELLNQPAVGVLKGGGGEAERNPHKALKLYKFQNNDIGEDIRDENRPENREETRWPAMIDKTVMDHGPVSVEYLKSVWTGEVEDEYATAKIIGTAAQALYLMNKAVSPEAAESLAQDYWRQHQEN